MSEEEEQYKELPVKRVPDYRQQIESSQKVYFHELLSRRVTSSKSQRKPQHKRFSLHSAIVFISLRLFLYCSLLLNQHWQSAVAATRHYAQQSSDKYDHEPRDELVPYVSSVVDPRYPFVHPNELKSFNELLYAFFVGHRTTASGPRPNWLNASSRDGSAWKGGGPGWTLSGRERPLTRVARELPFEQEVSSSTTEHPSSTTDMYRIAVEKYQQSLLEENNPSSSSSSPSSVSSSTSSLEPEEESTNVGSVGSSSSTTAFSIYFGPPNEDYFTTPFGTETTTVYDGPPTTTEDPMLTTDINGRNALEAKVWNDFVDRMTNVTFANGSMVFLGGSLSLITVVGNLLVMLSFQVDKSLQTVSNYFLLSLAIADFLIGCVSMPLALIYIITRGWPLGAKVCDFWLSVDYLNSNASVLNLLLISFDRFFSVTRPLSYRAKRTNQRACCLITLAWILSTLLWPPWIFAWPYIEGQRTVPANQCYIPFLESNPTVTIITATLAFWLPLMCMIWLYWKIYNETQQRNRELNSIGGFVSAGACTLSSDKKLSKKKGGKWASDRTDKSTTNGTSEAGTTLADKLVHLIHSSNCERAKRREASLLSGVIDQARNGSSDAPAVAPFPIELSNASGEVSTSQHHQQVNIAMSSEPMPRIFSTHDYADEMIHMEELNSSVNGVNTSTVAVTPATTSATTSTNHQHEIAVTETSSLMRPSTIPVRIASAIEARRNSRWDRISGRCRWLCCCFRRRRPPVEVVPTTCPACEYIKTVRRRYIEMQKQAELDAIAAVAAREKAAADAAAAATAAIAAAIEARARKQAEMLAKNPQLQQQQPQQQQQQQPQPPKPQHVHSATVEVHVSNSDIEVPNGDLRVTTGDLQVTTTTSDTAVSNGDIPASMGDLPNGDLQVISVADSGGGGSSSDGNGNVESAHLSISASCSGNETDESDNSIYTIVIKLDPPSQNGDGAEPNATVRMMCSQSPEPLIVPQLNAKTGEPVKSETTQQVESQVQPRQSDSPEKKTSDKPTTTEQSSTSEPSKPPESTKPARPPTTNGVKNTDKTEGLSKIPEMDNFDEDGFDLSDIEPWAHLINLAELGMDDDNKSEAGSVQMGQCCMALLRRGKRGSTASRVPDNISMATGQYLLRCNVQPTKNERKAARILSAILLAFFITWTPYNVLVLVKTFRPELIDSDGMLWQFSYYLCYINSTLNPVCYAMCNQSFRRTYIRILTCSFQKEKNKVHSDAARANQERRRKRIQAAVDEALRTGKPLPFPMPSTSTGRGTGRGRGKARGRGPSPARGGTRGVVRSIGSSAVSGSRTGGSTAGPSRTAAKIPASFQREQNRARFQSFEPNSYA